MGSLLTQVQYLKPQKATLSQNIGLKIIVFKIIRHGYLGQTLGHKSQIRTHGDGQAPPNQRITARRTSQGEALLFNLIFISILGKRKEL